MNEVSGQGAPSPGSCATTEAPNLESAASTLSEAASSLA